MNGIAAVDIGGTKIAAGVEHPDHDVTAPTPGGPDAIVATVVDLVRSLRVPGLRAVGVGSAGTFDPAGTVVAATDLIPGWTGYPLASRLRDELGVPVTVLNDVHAAALGEAAAGAGRGVARVLVAATGTGLGGAVVLGGAVDPGGHGVAGSLGHVALPGLDRVCSCGRVGHAEPYASGPGMERSFAELGGGSEGLRRIGELAQSGDERAVAAIRIGGEALGRALAAAAAIADPDLVIVGGGPSQLGEVLLGPTRAAFRAEAPALLAEVPVVAAGLGPRAAIVGAREAARLAL